jgi:hypothetical protein
MFGPYKIYYNVCLNDWMLSNPCKPVTVYSVASITGKSFSKAFTKHNSDMQFHVTGMTYMKILVKMNSFSPMSLTDLTVR